MAELTTYDFFMDELLDLEKSVYRLVQGDEEISAEKESLIKELRSLKDENEILRIKLEEAERKVDNSSEYFDSSLFNSEDKEVVKEKIDELINKIDNHLRS
ncbi:MAG: hypothetical protein PF445_02280 [Melioribacteraceae bacterium]|nr:hypothetical protein [Melioribacteraceae bacterium]